MKYFFSFILLFIISTGCEPHILSGVELKNKLKETMKDHLLKTVEPGTQITVKDVVYYPEKRKNMYICQFHVNMRLGKSDTTGLVVATITNDFSTVNRTQ